MAEGGPPGPAPHMEHPPLQPIPTTLTTATWPTSSYACELVPF